jgi:hypothetical protein
MGVLKSYRGNETAEGIRDLSKIYFGFSAR